MLSWSAKRKLVIISILVILFGTPAGLYIYKKSQKPPSCSDGIQNQNERGVDCGGICRIACFANVKQDPDIQWARAYYVAKGTYNLVAYIQNPNIDYISQPAKYIFKVYDENNVLIATREGIVGIPTSKIFPIFEATVQTKEVVPKLVTFEFVEPVTWIEYFGNKPELEVVEQRLTRVDTQPKLDVKIVNRTLKSYRNVEVVAIIYNEEGNGVLSSRTFIDSIGDKGEASVVFTWPEPITFKPSKIEVIPNLALKQYK
ncbi:hypothetical protein H7Y21_02660 [Arenimonas sp.]|nr:hypothetical protein [Candidatus Parcubacteria bacterium]